MQLDSKMVDFSNNQVKIKMQQQTNLFQMSLSKRVGINRPNLFVQISDFEKRIKDFQDGEYRNEVAVKPLRSVKNMHQMRSFDFGEDNVEVINTQRKLRKISQLEQEKTNLMRSLEILKMSAVSVIVEKDQQIEKLRVGEQPSGDEQLELYAKQLEVSKHIMNELEEEREHLHKEMYQERSRYISEIEQKQNVIEGLIEEIEQVRRDLQVLEMNDLAKTRKIKLLQEENSQLSVQLELSNIVSSQREKSEILDLNNTMRKGSMLSGASSIPNRSFVSLIDSERLFDNEIDRTYLTEKLEDLDKIHKEEILQLRHFYQKRIEGLRDIYTREEKLPTYQNDRDSEAVSQSISRSRSVSVTSGGRYKTPQRYQQNPGIHLNLKEMYSIEQSVQKQLQTSRSKCQNLRYQIKMQNLSECPSVRQQNQNQQILYTNEDAESQFTTKYFQNPFRFMRKNMSSEAFSVVDQQEVKTICKRKETDATKEIKQFDKQTKEKGWNTSYIFAAGLLSGVTITSLVGFLIKKIDV